MAASLDGALDLTPDAVRRVLELIEKPPAPTPDLIRLFRDHPATSPSKKSK